jgi:hypothetical protein
MRSFLLTLSLLFALATVQAEVVRLAPDFTFGGVGKTESLKSLRGMPVVLIIAKSPKLKEVKVQAKNLREIYQEFANKHVIFAAAFTGESGLVPSDIPFVIATNGAAVAGAYGVQGTSGGSRSFMPEWLRPTGGSGDFTIVIIGKDGNIDYQTDKVLPSSRVRDVIQNSYAVQANTGRQ